MKNAAFLSSDFCISPGATGEGCLIFKNVLVGNFGISLQCLHSISFL